MVKWCKMRSEDRIHTIIIILIQSLVSNRYHATPFTFRKDQEVQHNSSVFTWGAGSDKILAHGKEEEGEGNCCNHGRADSKQQLNTTRSMKVKLPALL